jgi:uncharacterized protein YcbK (DUF882 family)
MCTHKMAVFPKNFKSVCLSLMAAAFLTAAHSPAAVAARNSTRFFHHGDGRIDLLGLKSGYSFSGRYRLTNGKYDPAALASIQRVFDAPAGVPLAHISLRLIEFIDFLQDHFNPNARIEIASGWRSPQYNTRLRKEGRLAATASLHQYGMAADIRMDGVPARRIWYFVRRLGFGGVGYYHGSTVHVDVGPARFWDEKTSGVGTDISTDNKLICLVADYDIYRPGNPVGLRFTRMTAFPIDVSVKFTLERVNESGIAEKPEFFRPVLAVKERSPCAMFTDIRQMLNIRWKLPGDLRAGRYRIRARFCDRQWASMPAQIATSVFEVRAR